MPDGKADASQKGKEVAIKFFILGGFTWFLSKVLCYFRLLGNLYLEYDRQETNDKI